MFGRYNKAITALVVGGLGWAGVVISSSGSPISSSEWLAGAVALATAVGVYGVPNNG